MQYGLLRLLVSHGQITVVGDDDQVISLSFVDYFPRIPFYFLLKVDSLHACMYMRASICVFDNMSSV